ncbi:MAG: DUF721 domain-containing protein [Bdellovibrionaceae bacterium]|nr:DUF721 domain-containing protein [Pseudobdellovibrionaceae bacterium]
MDELDYKTKFKVSSQVLQSLFEDGKSPLSEHFLRWKLWSRWKELMGDGIAENSEPVGYYQKKLYVYVKNSSVMHHMYFLKKNMLLKIAKEFHPTFIKEMIFTLDKKSVPRESLQSNALKEDIDKILQRDSED